MVFSPRNIIGLFPLKMLTRRGGHGHPRSPPRYALARPQHESGNCLPRNVTQLLNIAQEESNLKKKQRNKTKSRKQKEKAFMSFTHGYLNGDSYPFTKLLRKNTFKVNSAVYVGANYRRATNCPREIPESDGAHVFKYRAAYGASSLFCCSLSTNLQYSGDKSCLNTSFIFVDNIY